MSRRPDAPRQACLTEQAQVVAPWDLTRSWPRRRRRRRDPADTHSATSASCPGARAASRRRRRSCWCLPSCSAFRALLDLAGDDHGGDERSADAATRGTARGRRVATLGVPWLTAGPPLPQGGDAADDVDEYRPLGALFALDTTRAPATPALTKKSGPARYSPSLSSPRGGGSMAWPTRSLVGSWAGQPTRWSAVRPGPRTPAPRRSRAARRR